jgi:hypothetical protein
MTPQDTDGMISIGNRSWRFPGARIDTDSWEVEWRGDGRLYLHDGFGNAVEGTEVDNAEVLAVVPLPTPQERSLRETLLARLMLVAVDIVLAGDPLGLETARDLIREVGHAYPELGAQARGGWEELLDHGTCSLIAQAWVENAKSNRSSFPSKEQASRDEHTAQKL